MKIEDGKIVEAYNYAVESGHPDPSGLLARAKIKTGFDFDSREPDGYGTFGVNKKKAYDLGYDKDELDITDANLDATIDVDLSSYRKADGDVDEMFAISAGGDKKTNAEFMEKLRKERKKIEDRLVFDEGLLVELKEKPEAEKPLESVKTTDQAEEKANRLTSEDKVKIEGLVDKVIDIIVSERPA